HARIPLSAARQGGRDHRTRERDPDRRRDGSRASRRARARAQIRRARRRRLRAAARLCRSAHPPGPEAASCVRSDGRPRAQRRPPDAGRHRRARERDLRVASAAAGASMTTPRASRAWIDSRHLRESAGGAAALAGLDQLAPATRERLLERADRIATVSTSLAHAFLPRAVEAAAAGVPVYDAWEAAL